MNEPEVRKLLLVIRNSYSGFDYDDDKVEIWTDLLRDVPFPLAQMNARNHIMDSKKPFPPTPGELAKPEESPDQIALYHDHMRESARSFIAERDTWKATPPPDHISNMMRLPEPERSEALREYARINRDRSIGETAST